MAMPIGFFFYGTLIAGSGNAAARAVHRRLRAIGPASVLGMLWAIPDPWGWYPALVATPGEGRVHGAVYVAQEGSGADELSLLDQWEDYRRHDPGASLYLRETMPVIMADGRSLVARVYRYNQPLPPAAEPIPGGDFRAWLVERGEAGYGDRE